MGNDLHAAVANCRKDLMQRFGYYVGEFKKFLP